MRATAVILLLSTSLVVAGVYADNFGTGANQFSIDFVSIGNAGNVGETQDYGGTYGGVLTFGAVDYDYQIGKYEVTLDQFAKARAADNRIGNGDEGYWNDGTRTVGTGAPASWVSWSEGAKFANWLTTGDAYTGAYVFDDAGLFTAVDRAAAISTYGTVYVLPTEDEWYKAAYYRPVNDGSYSPYSSGLDTVPTWGTADGWNYRNASFQFVNSSPNYTWETGFGGVEQNGTYDMMGNVWEMTEGTINGTDIDHYARGGSYGNIESDIRSSHRSFGATTGGSIYGFRVAAVPEPSTVSLLGFSAVAGVLLRRRRTKSGTKNLPPPSDRFMEQW